MNKTMTQLLMWSLYLCCNTLVWSNTHSTSSDTLPPQLIQRKATGTRLAPNAILLQANGGDEYQWSTGASTSSININAPTSPQKYSVHIKRNKTHENWLIQQTVYPTNDVAVSASQQLGCSNVGLRWQSRVCAGTSVTIQAWGGVSYEWENGETTSSITVVPTNGAIYRVTITGANGCEDVQTTTSAPMEIIPVPVAQISVSNNECSVIGAILTASGGETYLWAEGQTTQSIVTEESTLYEVRVSNGNGLCTDTESIWVSTNFQPKISGDKQLCQGQGATLTASGGNTYLWDNGATSSSITVLPTDVGAHTYKVRVNAGTCSREVSHTINVKATPNAQISGPTSVCYNGSVTLTASGSGTYAWTTGATTSSISVSLLQSNQTYGLTVTNPSTQCSSVAEHVVTVLPRPTLNEAPNSICAGGSVNLSVTGGSSYSWNVGGTTASIVHSPGSSTEYRVTVTDASGCSYVLSKSISVTSPPSITFGGGTSICAGQSLNITAFGGSTYSWNYNSANTATITVSPTVNTTYTVTATSSGCSSSAQRVIVVKPSPIGNIDAPSSICPGQSVTLIATGGGTYLWNVGNATTASITVNPTQNTNYTVNISNVEGCTVVKSHAIAVNISGSASNDGPLTCSKTSATLSGTSSAQGASYRWKNASGVTIANTANTTVTTAGVYTLEITAAGGCAYSTATEVLQNLQTPSVSASSSGAITCTQSSVNLLGTSSASPATYEWRNGEGTLIANTLNTSVTQAGTYTLKVTAANGCSGTASATVTADLTSPQVNVQHDGALTCTKTNAILSASSSTPGLQYTWKNAAGNTLGTGSSIQVNTSGTYWLEARGSNACMFSQSITLTQSGSLPTVNVSKSTSGCNFTLQGSSTTPGVTYAWSNQNGRVVATTPNFTTNQEGTYTLKVSTATGCSQQASINAFAYGTTVSISIDGASQGYLTYHKTNLTCTKNSVVLSANSSDAIESYFWVSPSGTPLGYNPSLTATQTGTYLLIAGTENGCPQTHEVLVERINTMPAVQITGDSTLCRYTSTTLSAYMYGASYQWSNGSTASSINTGSVSSDVSFEVTVTMGSCQRTVRRTVRVEGQAPGGTTAGPTQPCTHIPVTYSASGGSNYKWSSGETTATIGVPSGFTNTNWVSYWVDISDQYGCTTRRSFTVKPTGSPVVTVTGIPTAPFCAQASINLAASAGGAWGNYLWSTGETTTNLQKTLHESTALNLKFTASNGCVVTKSINVEVVPRPSPQILGGDIACAGDNTTLTATGGTSYLWNTNATTSNISINQPTQSQTYTVTASSIPGCTGVASKVVTVPAPLSLSHNLAGDDDCIPNNAAVLPTVSGGTGSIKLGLIRSGELYVSENLSGLSSGTYLLRAEDTKGCLTLDEVVIAETPVRITHIDLSNLNDCSHNNVQATIQVDGANSNLRYVVTGKAEGSSNIFTNLRNGQYQAIIRDVVTTCQDTFNFSVQEIDHFRIGYSTGNAICYGASTGGINVQAFGGLPPYQYNWSTGATTNKIEDLAPGTYTVTVSDARACSWEQTIEILGPSQNNLPQITFSGDTSICAGSNFSLSASGGYSYAWNTGASTSSISGALDSTTIYTVTVTDTQGCSSTASQRVRVKALPSPKIEGITIICAGQSTTLTAIGGSTYAWQHGPTTANITVSPTSTTTYEVTVTNAEGCYAEASKELVVPDSLSLSYELTNDQDCIANNVVITPQAIGGTGSKSFQLRRSGETSPYTNLSGWGSGEYVLVVRDSLDCVATKGLSIQEPDSLELSVQQISGALDCTKDNNEIQTSVQHARGSVQYRIWGISTEFNSSALFSNVPMGTQIVEARDSMGCTDTLSIEVEEWVPVQITQVQMLHHTDCTPGNTGARIVTTPSGRSLWYQKEDAAPQPVDSFSNLQKGYHQVIVSDSLGCKDTTNILVLEEAFPYYQVLSPTDCDSANAAIRFSRAAYNAKFEYSVNAGLAWSNSRTFERLTPGRYHPAVRKVDSGCIAEGDSITIGPDCPVQPRAGFVKDSIVVSDPKQLVALQWYVESPLWFKDSFSVVLLRRGQFSPHFTELSAWNSPVVVDAEYPGAVNLQQDFQLPLADTLGQYTQLTEYYFELIAPVGSPVLIDPRHKVMKVVVNFGDGCLSEPDPIVVCQGQEVRIGQTHIRNPQCIEWSHSSSEELELVFKAESEGEYTQTVVDADGNVCVAHYKVQLKNPEVSIESQQQDGACPQDQVELKAVHEGVAKNYKWELIIKDEPGAAPVYMGDTRIIQVSPGFEYQLSVTFSSGCTAHANIDIEDLAESACNIKKYFEGKGFFAIPIEIGGDPQARKKPDLRDDLCAETTCNGICVRDDAGLGFKLNGKDVGGLKSIAERALNSFKGYGYDESYAFISGNDQVCACNDYLKKAEQRFTSAKLGFWLHIFEGQDCGGQDYLFVKSTSATDAGFLAAGLDHFTNYDNFDPAIAIHEVAFDLMLPNFESPKTPEMFDKTPPNEPKRHTEAVEQKSSCEAGLQKNSVPVIVGSGHLVMLPEYSVWRFKHNPEIVGSIFPGALAGYTQFSASSRPSIYEARWGLGSNGKRYHVGFFKMGTVNPEVSNFLALNASSQSFALPSGTDIETYFGEHVVLSNEDGGCNQAYQIHKAHIKPAKGFLAKPYGELTANRSDIGQFSQEVKAENGFYKICPSDLSEVVEGIKSGEDITGYFSFGFTGGGMLYALNPGSQKFTDWVLVRKDEKTGAYTYYQWNCTLAIWQIYNGPDDIAKIEKTYAFFEKQILQEGLHNALDLIGFVPFLGEVADLANATMYVIEGQYGKAAFSAAMVIVPPGADWLGRALNLSGKLGKISARVKHIVKITCASAPPGLVETDAQGGCSTYIIKKLGAGFQDALNRIGLSPDGFDLINNTLVANLPLATKVFHWLAARTDQYDNFAKVWKEAFDGLQMSTTQIETLLDDLASAGNELVEAIGQNVNLLNAWRLGLERNLLEVLRRNPKVLSYMDEISSGPRLGEAVAVPNIAIDNHRGRFYAAFKNAPEDMAIHHALPQAVFDSKYPGMVTEAQLHSLENLRGIPNTERFGQISLHQHITNRWAAFYNTHPAATTTLDDVLQFVKEIDNDYGHLFIPPVR